MKEFKQKPRGDYEIGYAKTPQAYKYKKGQSGYPSGRPKRSHIVESDEEIFLRFVMEKIPATRNGKPIKMTKWQVIGGRALNEGTITKTRDLALQLMRCIGDGEAPVTYVKMDEKLART